jgi:hypothetical protein
MRSRIRDQKALEPEKSPAHRRAGRDRDERSEVLTLDVVDALAHPRPEGPGARKIPCPSEGRGFHSGE